MPEGKSNKQLRDWVKQQEVKYNSVKKRHLKDLSIEEINEIVSAAQIPYMLQKDIAPYKCNETSDFLPPQPILYHSPAGSRDH